MNVIKPFQSLDSILQNGTDNIASKANELIGVSNYHISNSFFGAAGLVYSIPAMVDLFGSENPDFPWIIFRLGLGLGYNTYQLYRNKRLETMESEKQNQESEDITIDFRLKEQKRRWVGVFPNTSGKLAYTLWSIIHIALSIDSFTTAADLALLPAQYFRETDYLKPTKKNRVFDFARSLLPTRTESRYGIITDTVQTEYDKIQLK